LVFIPERSYQIPEFGCFGIVEVHVVQSKPIFDSSV
jgi:hypothetical protein